jgi:hypothetical protein
VSRTYELVQRPWGWVLVNQCILDSLRETLPESTSKGIVVPADKTLAEAKLDGVCGSRAQLSKCRELTFMVGDFVRVPKHQLQGTFKGGKGGELRGWSGWRCLVCGKDGSKPIVCRPTEVSTSPEDLLGIVGETFGFVEELAMTPSEKFVELTLLTVELLKRRGL